MAKQQAIFIALQAKKNDVKKISDMLKKLTRTRTALIDIVTSRQKIVNTAKVLKKLTKPLEVKVKPVLDKIQVDKLKQKMSKIKKPISIPVKLKVKTGAAKSKIKGLVSFIKKSLKTGLVVGGLLAGLGLAKFTVEAKQFGKSMAEVSTLTDSTRQENKKLTASVLDLSNQTGISATELSKGLYQAISSGAIEAGDSQKFLLLSTKLAIGGVATFSESVNLISGIMNTYNVSIDRAAQISDVMFKTVKAGKTTIPELAASLGKVAPLAASMGISLESVSSAVATLTTSGRNTAEATVQVRQLLAAIIKQAPTAQKEAKRLGIDFSLAAIRTKGFSGFLAELNEKTKGNVASMNKLFPEINASLGAITLAGIGFNKFNKTLEETTKNAGATQEAFLKVSQDATFTFDQALNVLKNIGIEIGTKIIKFVADWVKDLGGVNVLVLKIKKTWVGVKIVAFAVKKVFVDVTAALTSTAIAAIKVRKVLFQIGTLGIGSTKIYDKWIGQLEKFGKVLELSSKDLTDLNNAGEEFSKIQDEIDKTLARQKDKRKDNLDILNKTKSPIKIQTDMLDRQLEASKKLTDIEKRRLALAKSTAAEFIRLNASQREQVTAIAERLSKGSFAEFEKLVNLKETRDIIGKSGTLRKIVESRGFGQQLAGQTGVFQSLRESGALKKELKIDNTIKIELSGEAIEAAVVSKVVPAVFEAIEKGKQLLFDFFEVEGNKRQAADRTSLTGS